MNLDEAINQFRIASRELFNNFFRTLNPYENDGWLYEERFRAVEEVLFRNLVTAPAFIEDIRYGETQYGIEVELRMCDSAPVMLNREISSGYWDYPISEISKGVQMVFISFFDWDKLDYHDNRYVRVQISGWPSHPEAIGKHALIESQYVRFINLQTQTQ